MPWFGHKTIHANSSVRVTCADFYTTHLRNVRRAQAEREVKEKLEATETWMTRAKAATVIQNVDMETKWQGDMTKGAKPTKGKGKYGNQWAHQNP